MASWKVYRITSIDAHPDWIKFNLNDSVEYRDSHKMYIDCKNCSPFDGLRSGDEIEIDNDKTRYEYNVYNFTTSEVRVYNSVSMALVRTQEQNSSLQTQNYHLQQEKNNLQSLIEAGKGQLAAKDSQISSYSYQLSAAQSQLRDKEGELTITRGQLEELRGLFTNLQIENNNKNNEINSLKEELEKSQNIDLRYKERKLDELIRSLGLDQEKERIDNLRAAYIRLKCASDPESYNRDNITAAQNQIDAIKRELFQNNNQININDLHKIYRVCEKVAELRVKQEKLGEQQFEARQQQVPPRNNI